MAGRIAVAVALIGVAALLRAAAGCSTSNTLSAAPCAGGCLCAPVDACPAGCYPSHTEQPDGSASESFCSNGIVECVDSGVAWSTGAPMNNCLSGTPTYLEGGPAGAFCCVMPDADASACTDADIQASNYDTSCKADSDCIRVIVGNTCAMCFACPNATINAGAQGQYLSDINKAAPNTACAETCISLPGPCCLGGMCQLSSQCVAPVPAADGGADTGAGVVTDSGPLDAGGK